MLPLGIGAAVLLVLVNTCSADICFGQRLFDGSMQHANQSLHSRFINRMVEGTLPWEAFQYFLYQDNLYLSKYARAFAVLGAKAGSTDELNWLLNQSLKYLHEHGSGANAHLDEKTFERDASITTVDYTSFVLKSAWAEDMVLGYAAALPCQKLYDWLFATVKKTHHIDSSNIYKKFIDQYADPENHKTTKMLESFLERYAKRGLTEDLIARAQYHYNTAMLYEFDFFEQALHQCELDPCPSLAAEPPKGVSKAFALERQPEAQGLAFGLLTLGCCLAVGLCYIVSCTKNFSGPFLEEHHKASLFVKLV